MFRLKLHISVNISVNSWWICTKPSWSRVNFSRRSQWGVTTHVLTKKACFGQYLSEFLMELPQTTTNHDMDHYKWWHESSQITINHKFTMTWITTNHKSLQITTNHDMNHHDDPKRALHQAIWLPCYEWYCPFYEWDYLDLIVTFLWTTLI